MLERRHFVVLILLETQKQEKQETSLELVVLQWSSIVRCDQKRRVYTGAVRLVLHRSNAKQTKTRGTKVGMPRWTDRNHERRYHIHKNLRNDVDGWDRRPSISGRPGPPRRPVDHGRVLHS